VDVLCRQQQYEVGLKKKVRKCHNQIKDIQSIAATEAEAASSEEMLSEI